MDKKKQLLIKDIENLLNKYSGFASTSIDPSLLQFMDEQTLISVIDSLLKQKEDLKEVDTQWLEQFKRVNS